jgi:hypothetical protein
LKNLLGIFVAALLLFLLLRAYGGAPLASLPKAVDAASCLTGPTIDGMIDASEWRDAPPLTFEIRMIRIDPAATEMRTCELRVMNSANALYVALRVPDSTVDNSLAPLKLDAAVLAFCRGDQVRARDDRKVIAQGIYRDKFVLAPGKDDGDDAQQDGRGAMTRDKGICSFEWAVPLGSSDLDDLAAKPGDSFRFNLAYFDALQLPITSTTIGGVFSVRLDQADEWATLRLAGNVKDDGGTAFQAPAWVKQVAERLKSFSPARLRVISETLVVQPGPPTAKVLIAFSYRDLEGKEKEARAKVYLPRSVLDAGNRRAPLFFAAGYELPDGAETDYVKRGWIVVSPRELEANPLIRNINPDVALLHLMRAIPWVDDARVAIGGGSAGGWMTLMLAAETFPLAGAVADVPPVNWGYNGAYLFKQLDLTGPSAGTAAAKVPALFAVGTLLKPCLNVYGGDFNGPDWFAESPLAVVSTITCPVSVYFSTADVLVPINQVGARWVQPFDSSQFPERFTMEPDKLMTGREGRLRLLDVLPEEAYEVFTLPVPAGTSRHNILGQPARPTTCELPTSVRKPWSIAIIDEGPPVPNIDHRKYALTPTRHAVWDRVATGTVEPAQLTALKLEQLMDRYAGKARSASRLNHLDYPDSERADVVRGLKTYVASSAASLQKFAALYVRLPASKRLFSPELLNELTERPHGGRQAPSEGQPTR